MQARPKLMWNILWLKMFDVSLGFFAFLNMKLDTNNKYYATGGRKCSYIKF